MAERSLRILQLNSERAWRGGERQTLLTALGLRKRGHRVELLLRHDSALASRALAEGFVVHAATGSLSFAQWLVLHGAEFDVLHVQTAKVLAWTLATKYFHQRPVVFSRRTSFPLGARAWLTRLKWRRVDQMVAISEASASAPRELGITTNVIPSAVLPVHACPEKIQTLLQRQGLVGRRLIGTAAALSLEKDPVTLIRAAAKVCAQFDDVTFLHWGAEGAAAEAARQAIQENGLQQRYLLLGFEAEVERLFSALSVFVMASRYEALGSSVLDAMLQQVAVVSTDAGGLKETVGQGRGLLCAPGDSAAMAQHICSLLTNPEGARAMAQQAYEQVLAQYNVDHMVEQYLTIYRRALQQAA